MQNVKKIHLRKFSPRKHFKVQWSYSLFRLGFKPCISSGYGKAASMLQISVDHGIIDDGVWMNPVSQDMLSPLLRQPLDENLHWFSALKLYRENLLLTLNKDMERTIRLHSAWTSYDSGIS